MRRLSQLSLHLSLGLSMMGFMAAPVFAQDLGTYRPGQAYQSLSSPAADICNSHCAGDAQCRAWNYVKVNPKASGVCEFLASASAPVASAISISGENTSQKSFSRPLSQGGTNTVRVGTSAKPAPAGASVTRPAPNRRVVREAVSQRVQPQITANRRSQPRRQQTTSRANGGLSLTEQQNQFRRQTGDLRQDPRLQNPRLQDPRLQDPRLQNPRLQDPRLQQLQQRQRQAAIGKQRQQRPNQPGQNQQRPQQPQFQPFLDGAAANRANRRAAPQGVREQLRQNQARQGQVSQGYQDQNYQGQPRQQQQAAQRRGQDIRGQRARIQGSQQRSQRRRQAGGRPPIGQAIGPVSPSISEQNARLQPRQQTPARQDLRAQAPQPRSSVNLPRASAAAPVTNQNAREAFARRQADLAAIASGNSVDPIQQSLYGTLNDDVKVRAQLKRLPSDLEASIATSASRPVTPVQTLPLDQLAGGPR